MSLVAALKALLGDLAALFSGAGVRTWFLLAGGTVLQVAFWYLGTPGPALLGFTPNSLGAAAVGITWTVVALLVVPSLLYTTTGGTLRDMRLSRGDARTGWRLVAACSLVAVPVIALAAAGDDTLATAYPWAGLEAGGSLRTLLVWAALYALYYLAFEAFYRGFLLRVLESAYGTTSAIWLQAFAATLVHLGKPLPETLAALPASLVFGAIAVRTRSVVYPAVLHLVIGLTLDVTILARAGALLR